MPSQKTKKKFKIKIGWWISENIYINLFIYLFIYKIGLWFSKNKENIFLGWWILKNKKNIYFGLWTRKI